MAGKQWYISNYFHIQFEHKKDFNRSVPSINDLFGVKNFSLKDLNICLIDVRTFII